MNWYEEAARHQSELRQEAANERAGPRSGSWTGVLDWFKRLFGWSAGRGHERAQIRPAINPVPDAVSPVSRLLADHHAAQPFVESRGGIVSHHHAKPEAATAAGLEAKRCGSHEESAGASATRGEGHMERFHPRLWVVHGVEECKGDHHAGLVDRHEERRAGEDQLLA